MTADVGKELEVEDVFGVKLTDPSSLKPPPSLILRGDQE